MTYSMRQAGVSDQSAALKLIDAYYREQDARDISEKTQSALTLLNNPQLGVIWLIETAGDAVGYMVICFGYSIECGHDAFVDELFVLPGHRNRGAGRMALKAADAIAAKAGVRTLHLEVMHSNLAAITLYRSLGYQPRNEYFLMSRTVRP